MKSMRPDDPPDPPRRPYAWLVLAVLGALGYVGSRLLLLDPARAQAITREPSTLLQTDLPVIASAGLVLLFLGLLGALWRARRIRGPTRSGRAGVAVGALGALVLAFSTVALPVVLQESPGSVPPVLADAGAPAALAGTAFVFLGLVCLAAGLVSPAERADDRDAVADGDEMASEDQDATIRTVSDLLEGL